MKRRPTSMGHLNAPQGAPRKVAGSTKRMRSNPPFSRRAPRRSSRWPTGFALAPQRGEQANPRLHQLVKLRRSTPCNACWLLEKLQCCPTMGLTFQKSAARSHRRRADRARRHGRRVRAKCVSPGASLRSVLWVAGDLSLAVTAHDARDGVEFGVADPDLDLRLRLDVAHPVGGLALGNKVEVPAMR